MNFIRVFLILLMTIAVSSQDTKKYQKMQYDTLSKSLDTMDVKYDSLMMKMEQLKKK